MEVHCSLHIYIYTHIIHCGGVVDGCASNVVVLCLILCMCLMCLSHHPQASCRFTLVVFTHQAPNDAHDVVVGHLS